MVADLGDEIVRQRQQASTQTRAIFGTLRTHGHGEETAQPTGRVEQVVEERALQDLAALLGTDVSEGDEHDGHVVEERRRGAHLEVERRAVGPCDPALRGLRGVRLEALRDRVDAAAIRAAPPGPTAPRRLGHGPTTERLARALAEEVFDGLDAQVVEESLVRGEDLPELVEHHRGPRQAIEHLANGLRAADTFRGLGDRCGAGLARRQEEGASRFVRRHGLASPGNGGLTRGGSRSGSPAALPYR